jgi:hypothetical protein
MRALRRSRHVVAPQALRLVSGDRRSSCRRARTGSQAPSGAPQSPTSTERGYGQAHRKLRARIAREVSSATAVCAHYGLPIGPAEPWDLDHSDDRTMYLDASHSACNRASGGRKPPAPVRLYSRDCEKDRAGGIARRRARCEGTEAEHERLTVSVRPLGEPGGAEPPSSRRRSVGCTTLPSTHTRRGAHPPGRAFPQRKTLEEFDFSFQRSVRKTQVLHLGQLDFVAAEGNFVARA